MTNYEAARVAVTILAAIGGLAAAGGLGLAVIAWLSYRHDGGRMGLIAYLLGL